jgi:hypothetical protein
MAWASALVSIFPILIFGTVLYLFMRRSPGPPRPDKYDKLMKITELRERGALTDAEFEAEKRKILGHGS